METYVETYVETYLDKLTKAEAAATLLSIFIKQGLAFVGGLTAPGLSGAVTGGSTGGPTGASTVEIH